MTTQMSIRRDTTRTGPHDASAATGQALRLIQSAVAGEAALQDDVEHALDVIEREYPRSRSVTRKLRDHLFTSDLFGAEHKDTNCRNYFIELLHRVVHKVEVQTVKRG